MTTLDAGDATNHPRPQLRRPGIVLDGEWDYVADLDRVPSGADFSRRIVVPFAPETPASGIGSSKVGRAWYRRTIDVGRPADGSRVRVNFGAVERLARVWANGELVGVHEGSYDAFHVDITEAAGDGPVELVVAADDDQHDVDAPRGKQDWLDDPHGIFYPRTTGISRSVWVERVGEAAIEDLHWQADPADMVLHLSARVSGRWEGKRLAVRVTGAGQRILDLTIAVSSPEVHVSASIETDVPDFSRALVWSPHRPSLLDATVALLDGDGEVVDEVESYAAVRRISVEHGRFFLNGQPLFLRMALDQGYWPETGATPPDSQALRADIELAKSLGFNAVRKHQKIEDPRYFAWADRLGFVVWVEMPSAFRSSTTAHQRLLHEWGRAVQAHRSFPSVIGWVPMNESWGVGQVARDPRQRAFVEAMTAFTHALDGSRPVSPNDGWETVGGEIVGIHDYHQRADVLRERYLTRERVDEQVSTGRPVYRTVDLDGRRGDGRAVVLSEFGGIALAGEHTWGYQVVSSGEELVRRYRELWAAVHASDALAGACYTQLTDTYQEANGLVTFDRTPKAPVEQLAAATRGK